MKSIRLTMTAGLALLLASAVSNAERESPQTPVPSAGNVAFQNPAMQIHYRTATVGKLAIFYREAGPKDAPAILLCTAFRPRRTCFAI